LGKPSDRLSGQFADPKKSKIKVTIKEGDTVLEPISITGLPPAEATTNQKGPR
jgi:hypothetical protein